MRALCSAPMVVALMIGTVACSPSDADTTNIVDGTAPAATNFTPSTDADGTEPDAVSTTPAATNFTPSTDADGTEPDAVSARPLTEAELMGPTSTWPVLVGSPGWDDDGNDPYSIHICGETGSLKAFPEMSDLDHVDDVFDGAPGVVAEAVFAGTPDELATAYESTTQKLSDCLANPQVADLAEVGYLATGTPLPPLELGQADFGMRQQIEGLCEHRLALVLTPTRLVVVELFTGFRNGDQSTDGDFRAIVENAVRQATA